MIWLGGIAFQSSLLEMSAVVNYAGPQNRERCMDLANFLVDKVGYKELVFQTNCNSLLSFTPGILDATSRSLTALRFPISTFMMPL